LPDAQSERVHEDAAAAFHAVVQPDAPAERDLVGGALQECDRGKRPGRADDGGLHRFESGAGGDGFGSGGLSMEQLRRGGGRGKEGEWEEGSGGLGAGLHEPSWRGLRGGGMEGGFADLSEVAGSGFGAEERPGGGGQGAGEAESEHEGGALAGKRGEWDGVAGAWDGGDAALPDSLFHGRSGDREQGVCERGVCLDAGSFSGEAKRRGATFAGKCKSSGW